MAIVYLHKKKNTQEVFYVGIGKSEKRAFEKKGRNNYWKNITSKYGFESEITHKNISWEEACSIEKYLIFFYKSLGSLCNLTEGGEGILGFKKTDEMKGNSRIGMLGKKNMLGKKHSIDTIEKIKKGNKGKIISQECRDKLSKINKGRLLSEEIKKKISVSLSGINASWYNKKGALHNKSMSVLQYDKNGNFIKEYGSSREASIETGALHISECCSGKRKSSKGFIWVYKNKLNEVHSGR